MRVRLKHAATLLPDHHWYPAGAVVEIPLWEFDPEHHEELPDEPPAEPMPEFLE